MVARKTVVPNLSCFSGRGKSSIFFISPPKAPYIQELLTRITHFNRRVTKLTRSFAEFFFSIKELATCGGWSKCSTRILPKSNTLLGFDLGNEPSINNSDLHGLFAPKVPLKNSAKLRVNFVTLRLNLRKQPTISPRKFSTPKRFIVLAIRGQGGIQSLGRKTRFF